MTKLELILEDIKNGKPIVIVDDTDREDEGDIMLAAAKANIDNLVFCMNHARGLMCIPCCGTILDRLKIPPMVIDSTCKMQTPFTISVDAMEGITTGMSVYDRLKTISVILDKKSVSTDLARPGHLFPLRPRENLLKERRGHTEASIELTKLANLEPVAIIVEIMNEDGTMTRGKKMQEYIQKYELNSISVQEIYDAVYNESL